MQIIHFSDEVGWLNPHSVGGSGFVQRYFIRNWACEEGIIGLFLFSQIQIKSVRYYYPAQLRIKYLMLARGRHMKTILNTLRSEAESTIRALHALEQFTALRASPPAVKAMNKNVHFWLLFQSSLLTKVFIGIRRLFENDRDTFNFQTALNTMKSRLDEFLPQSSRGNSRASQSDQNGWTSTWHKCIQPVKRTSMRYQGLSVLTESLCKGSILPPPARSSRTQFTRTHRRSTMRWPIPISVKSRLHWMLFGISMSRCGKCTRNGRKPSLQVSTYPYKKEVQQCVIKEIELMA